MCPMYAWLLQNQFCPESLVQRWTFWVALIMVAFSLVLLAVLPHKGESFHIVAELLVFLTLLFVTDSDTSWLAAFMLLVVLVEAVSRLAGHRVSESAAVISPSGFSKLFLFFVQTSTTVDGVLWGSFREHLSFLDLKTGFVCTNGLQSLFSEEWKHLLFTQLMPFVLIVIVGVIFVFRLFVMTMRRGKNDGELVRAFFCDFVFVGFMTRF